MLGIENYGSFITAILIFQVIPGPGTLVILSATARKGTGAGMRAVFGTLAGDFTAMLAAVLGLAAVLSAYPGVLSAAQWIGVVYLCRLGWRLLRAPAPDQAPDRGDRLHFRQALAVSLTNPKVILFFMAFFPLFISTESGPVTLLALMAHVTAISFLYQTSLVLVGNTAARRLSRWRYARPIAARLAGASLIGFGVKLALDNR